MKFLVWSRKHGMWWRENWSGYTESVLEAGRYTFREAMVICKGSTVGGYGPIMNQCSFIENMVVPDPTSAPIFAIMFDEYSD